MTTASELADELEALAKASDDGSWDARAKANANLRNKLITNLPAILSALRGREVLREPTVLRIGAGEVSVDTGGYQGVPAVFIEPVLAGPVGESVEPPLPVNEVRPGSVVLQIVGDVSVLIDALNKIASRIQGGGE
ncbi:MAG: hypothetical protein ACOYM5_02930 [Caulobacter sp.]